MNTRCLLPRFIYLALFLVIAHSGHATDQQDGCKPLSLLTESLIELAKNHRDHAEEPPPIVAIGGSSGVGKTHLTKWIARLIQEQNIKCIIIHQDDFLFSPQERKKIGTEWDLRHLKVDLLHQTLFSICQGKQKLEKPTYSQVTGEVGLELIDFSGVDLILFEGIYTLSTEEPINFFDHCHIGVFLEAEMSNICKWRWEREQKRINPRSEEHFARYFQILLNDFHVRIAPTKINAAFIVKKDTEHNYTCELQY